MLRFRRSCLTGCLLVLSLVGCNVDYPLSPEFAARVSAPPPTVTATAISQERIDLTWQDNATSENGWEVHRSTTGPTGTFTLHSQLAANSSGYSDGGLLASTQYCYKVRSFKRSGRRTTFGEFSNVACATTLAPPTPAAPSEAAAQPAGSRAIAVSWRDNATNEDGFRIERSTDAGASWTVATTHPSLAAFPYATVTDTGRTSEQQVCYRVIAFNAGGDSPPSNIHCTAPPAAPSGLTATMIDSFTVTLAWTDNSAVEDGYEVWEAYLDGWGSILGPVYVASLPANTTEYQTGCCAYYYLVRAARDWGGSDFSNEAYPVFPGGSIRAGGRQP